MRNVLVTQLILKPDGTREANGCYKNSDGHPNHSNTQSLPLERGYDRENSMQPPAVDKLFRNPPHTPLPSAVRAYSNDYQRLDLEGRR